MRTPAGVNIGSFEVVSGICRISDPCYDVDTWCAGEVSNVKIGRWDAQVFGSERCESLVASYNGRIFTNDNRWKKLDIDVGVDSGQAGIFDSRFYKDDKSIQDTKRESQQIICGDDPWYSMCCDRTIGELGAGTIPYGCVSSSGYGDGSYNAYTIEVDGEIEAIKIVFIDPNEEEIDEDYEEEDEEEYEEEYDLDEKVRDDDE